MMTPIIIKTDSNSLPCMNHRNGWRNWGNRLYWKVQLSNNICSHRHSWGSHKLKFPTDSFVMSAVCFFFLFGCSLFFCHSAIPIILQPQPQALYKNKCNLSLLALAPSKMCNPTAHLPGLWFATTNPHPLVQRWALGFYSARITKANIHTCGVRPCRWIKFYFFYFRFWDLICVRHSCWHQNTQEWNEFLIVALEWRLLAKMM